MAVGSFFELTLALKTREKGKIKLITSFDSSFSLKALLSWALNTSTMSYMEVNQLIYPAVLNLQCEEFIPYLPKLIDYYLQKPSQLHSEFPLNL